MVQDASQAQQALSALLEGLPHPALRQGVSATGSLAVLFTGQGSQRLGMGRELHGQPGFEAYTQALDEVCSACDGHLERKLSDVMWADPAEPAHAALLAQTRFAQPALFALEVALYRQCYVLFDSFSYCYRAAVSDTTDCVAVLTAAISAPPASSSRHCASH